MTTAVAASAAVARRFGRSDIDRATRLLRACLTDPARSDPASVARLARGVSPAAALAVARYHGVAGLIFEPLRRSGGAPPALLEPVRETFEASVHRHLRATWDLMQAGRILDATGVAWVVVKGPAAVEQLYRGSGGRRYLDLDLLVDPAGFGPVVVALEADGFALLDRNWAVMRREMRGAVHHRGSSGLEIDLHWNLVNMYRGRMRVPTRELLARSEPVQLAGVGVRTLEPTDTLIHLCLHAAISGGDRMVWVKDIERAVAVRPPDWDELVARCDRWSVGAPVGLMLARAATFLGADVPGPALRTLLGRGTRVVIGAVDRLVPWPRALGRLASPNRLMARSIGQGALGAGAWLVVRSIRNLDPGQEHAESAFTPGGDERDRDAFIAAVMATEDA